MSKEKTIRSKSVNPNEVKKTKMKKSFIADLIENVEQGAKLVSDKTSETYEKVRKGAAEAIDTSSHVVTDLYYSASEYTDQFKDKIEMKKLNSEKEELFADLGKHFYRKYKIENESITKLSRNKKFTSLLKSIQQLDKEIVELGKNLKK